ncbi:DNA damage-inducible protein D (plasmid) [Bernardetia sp. ABR2-2B]|uniref:DNA damage-inducible protein D n=1 Tax=Bernardetia sp. ABR2-2B TaxID=3127472 RepID=UPI0030CB12AA
MKKLQSNELFEKLESVRNEIENVEFWSARDLQDIFGYDRWENFHKAVKRAAISIENTSESLENHFREVTKMVKLGSKAERKVKDYALTRYACYLVAQNGDSNKEEIAFAQSYFATQTRKQELIEKRVAEAERVRERDKLTLSEKLLSQLAFERGVDSAGFAFIRAKGDEAFFGGNNTQAMKNKLTVPKGRPLADYLPTVTIWGKGLATGITNHNIENKNLEGTNQIAQEHTTNNDEVRQLLIRRGIVPEELPAAEDAKKVKRRLNSEGKKLIRKKKK